MESTTATPPTPSTSRQPVTRQFDILKEHRSYCPYVVRSTEVPSLPAPSQVLPPTSSGHVRSNSGTSLFRFGSGAPTTQFDFHGNGNVLEGWRAVLTVVSRAGLGRRQQLRSMRGGRPSDDQQEAQEGEAMELDNVDAMVEVVKTSGGKDLLRYVRSLLSISSTSVISISSTAPSSPAPVPLAITTRSATVANNNKITGQKPKPRGRQFLEAVELKSPPPRRRSPRLNGGPTQVKAEKREVTMPAKHPSTPKKSRKRKNDFDDDTSEYNTSGDVIVVSPYRQSKVSTKAPASTTSPNKKLKTESPMETPCLSLSSKPSLAIPAQAEVIPSSQSDELEVEVQTTNVSGPRRSETSVESWLWQSQGDVDPGAGDMDNMDNMDMDVQMDVEELLASPHVKNPSLSLSPSRTSSLTSLSSRQSSPSPSTPAHSFLTTPPPPPSAARPPPSEKTPTSHATPKSASRPHKSTSTPTAQSPPNPGPVDPLKLATPTKLDEASKTAAFIAAIREHAFAASPPSRSPPDDEMAELKALSSDNDDSGLESDSGGVFFGGAVAKKAKGHNATSRSAVSPVTASSSTLASTSTSTSTSTSMASRSRSTALLLLSSSVQPPTRELRASRRSPDRDSTGSNATTRTPPGKRPQFLAHALFNVNSLKASDTRTTSKWGKEESTAQKKKTQKKKADPFASLLSEKCKAEKLGTAGLELALRLRWRL
ncbi:hypothetical protein BD410DRAFT_840848 [Rickenella mellea]|uniref:Uncharacterized protein n=1 Tax=Rickenella mellea TaxID=50990 RepID=A0A4Y7Q1W7_9AGAM|nr:hypothetical protein BD410DRAFT_840848 [Rickenella mellea]